MAFRNSFGENIFRNKYGQDRFVTWRELVVVLVDDVCGTRGGTLPPILSQETRDELVEVMAAMQFIPGGRYLYYAGRGLHAYNNCLGANTRVLTDNGWRQINELGVANVLSPVDGKYYPAEFVSRGVQQLQRITFANVRGHQTHTWSVDATRTHHWPLIDGTDTYDLRVGDVVPANTYEAGWDHAGFVHGFVFGDGNANGQLRLCGAKDQKHLTLLAQYGTVTHPLSANGDPVLYFGSDPKWKALPDPSASPAYVAGFIRGWLAADGSTTSSSSKLCSVNKEALEWFRDHAAFAGLVITGNLRSQVRDVTIGEHHYPSHELFVQTFAEGADFAGFKVVKIEPLGAEEVFCPFEPVHNRIVIDHGIDTFQCFLLRAEEDTREEWAELMNRSMRCLMLGGGIGIDYSRLREEGALLKRTGGTASGPIPLMYAVNEVGRNVKQGGSRRSAIYASLNWRHPDARKFLVAKNWDDMHIGTSGLTLWDAKQQDFNYPAPLDMTNVSLNYDDAWLNAPDRHLDETFFKNVEQALRTGEPGFSFNFGLKQNETLRNAPVTAGTMVLTIDGYRPVEELLGQAVTVWTGKQWAADVEFKQTSPKAEIVKIAFTGGREIRCDVSHPFLVERYEGAGDRRKLVAVDRIPAQELQPGDILHVSLPPVSPPSHRDTDAYTLGYIYGDGSFGSAGNAEITFCTDDSKRCADVVGGASRLSSVTEQDARGYTRAYFSVDQAYFGDRDKAVFPVELFKASVEEQASFVAGLFDADGNVDVSQHRVRLSSNHEGFLRDTARLLEQLGILAGVHKNGRSTYGQKQTYSLVVMADYVARFAEMIPTERLHIDTAGWLPYRSSAIKVESVERDGEEPVYCADVKVEEHTFMAEGIIISNCTEVTSEDDSDVCNLGSVNLSRIETVEQLRKVTYLASMFLVCGTLRADLPYEKVRLVREKNRRLGLGFMGVHEWLLKRGYRYEVTAELRNWLQAWKDESESGANTLCDQLGINRPVAYRAIAPTGTIGTLAGTTTGIEPVFAVAYKRRYLVGNTWKYEYVVDATAETLVKEGVNPDSIESANDLALDYERRIAFQADVQDYVDQAISSTINMPEWGSAANNPDMARVFASVLSKYAPRLRGFTVYPDGSRGGQPLVQVPYAEAVNSRGVVFEENDACAGGVCGI